MHMRLKRQLPVVLLLVLSIGTVTALNKRQAIYDWLRLRDYQPAQAIAQLAQDTTMNDFTRRLFYVQHPVLNDRENFGKNCPNRGEKTIILGCYVTRRGIYLFDVQDPRLTGVEQVTAAHETLHAVYDRLSAAERNRVNAMTEQAYDQLKNNRIKNTVEAYRTAGDDVSNELHSILGTEVRDLPPELETYYKKYFTDRSKIVAFSESYESAFTSREKEAEAIQAQLERIESSLPAKRSAIDNMEESLNTQYNELEQQRSSVRDAAEFNAKVSSYNSQIASYKRLIDEYNRLVSEHNNLLVKYNAVALEENELIKAIDSRSSSVPSE